jgi:nicotinamidase/pyrazinamidase
MFEGTTDEGHTVEGLLASRSLSEVDVVGLATDHCVRASALDARKAGVSVRVLRNLVAAVSPVTEESALREMSKAGVTFA